MRRYELSDLEWLLIEPHTLSQARMYGDTGRDNRLFSTAIFYRTRSSIPWRGLPARFGQYSIPLAAVFGARPWSGEWFFGPFGSRIRRGASSIQ
jgi:transposase